MTDRGAESAELRSGGARPRAIRHATPHPPAWTTRPGS